MAKRTKHWRCIMSLGKLSITKKKLEPIMVLEDDKLLKGTEKYQL